MNQKISLSEKIGFGLGDTASNLVFQVLIFFMLSFYTDVFGISAAAAGTMILVVRIFDGITDPVMGAIADRNRSKWGRYRPFLLYMAGPYALLAVLAFTTPDLSGSGKLIYAYVTYSLLTMAYTAINIPYSALGGVMTSDEKERASAQSVRMICAMVAGVLVTLLMDRLVTFFGQGNEQLGYSWAMGCFALLAVACFVTCFFMTKERVDPPAEEKRSNLFQDIGALFKNRPFMIIFAVAFLLLVAIAVRGSVATYYVEYVMLRPDLKGFFLSMGTAPSVAGALSVYFLLRIVDKRRLFIYGAIGSVISHVLLYVLPPTAVVPVFGAFALASYFHMIVIPLMFAFVADTADYGEKLSGKKTMGMAYSVNLFAIKMGLAVGGAMAGWILGWSGYKPNVEQSELAVTGIYVCLAVIPAVMAAGVLVLMRNYRLGDKSE